MVIENSYRPFKVAIAMAVGLFSNTKSNYKLSRSSLLRKCTNEPNLKALELP
jgi:hypothetical protein